MYLIATDKTRISKLGEKKFSELQFKERNHLQEWLANHPQALGEQLLVIQKEFDGFNGTNERLDLLALDKVGNLVIIENKIDDSGKDVTWQALKYASYCSSLTKDQIKQIFQDYLDKTTDGGIAEDKLSDFFDIDYEELILNTIAGQRIIMVAGKFRKEVTSTVTWLLNYNIRLKCFTATLYSLGEQCILDIKQILPTPEAEDYTIRMAEKAQDAIKTQETVNNNNTIRLQFWKEFLNQSSLFTSKGISPREDSWISTSIVSNVKLQPAISKSYVKVEIYININKEDNKRVFDLYKNHKQEIETEFGDKLIWERMNDKSTSRIRYQLDNVNVFEKNDWSKMIEFLVNVTQKMDKAFSPYKNEILDKIKAENNLSKKRQIENI